jgi:hypothetical protein
MTTLVALSDGPVLCLYAIAICAGELTLLPDPYSPPYKTRNAGVCSSPGQHIRQEPPQAQLKSVNTFLLISN